MYLNRDFFKQFSVFLRFFEVIACTYAILRNATKCSSVLKNVPSNIILSLTFMMLATLITIILYVPTLLLVFYKTLIVFILRIKHKQNFGGLLKGADVIWSGVNSGSNNVITYLLIIEFDRNKIDFLKYVKEICVKRFFRSNRLTCVRRSFMGYNFLIKNQLNVDDVVRELPAFQDLRKVLQDCCNEPLPKNNTAAWELLVGTQPIDLEDSGNQFPLLIRIHHTIADGMTFLSLLAKEISDESSLVSNMSQTQNSGSVNSLGKIWGGIKNFARLHSRLILFLNPADVNEFRKPKLSGRKRVGIYVERERRYLKVVRRIKGKVEGASFSSVIFTAVSASLDDHFKKKAQSPPENIIFSFIAIADRNDLNFNHSDLANIFSMGTIKLPIASNRNATLFQRFLSVQRAYSQFSQSHDIWINHCLFHVFGDLCPTPLLNFFLKMSDVQTIAISNLPGFQKIHINGHVLKNFLFWVPNYKSIGVGFSLITYDDKFQMGLMVDEVIIPEEDDVQEILNGVFKNIDLLDKELV